MKTDIALSYDHEPAADLAVPMTLFEIGGLEGPPDLLREKNVR
jgi:hypothetical protein